MESLSELHRIASEDGSFLPVILLGLAAQNDGSDPVQVALRSVANETLLRLILSAGKRSALHEAIDSLCDGTKPPDDQPHDGSLTHIVIET